ncbi:MAG: metallophosphoesterase family protein [Candidatus Tectomicrobia bacterium]
MRIALLSDMHGNSIALDEVLSDVQTLGGADAYWVLGDIVAMGHDPVGVLERLVALPNVCFVRGNTDRYTVAGDRFKPTPEQVNADFSLLPRLVARTQHFAWTLGAITTAGWLEWLCALPLEQRLVLPDGTRLLGVHASPGCDDGHGLNPTLSETARQALVVGCQADLVCVGHTHWPMEVKVGGVHLVNLGSVSMPFPPDLRASYVILEADARGYVVQHRRVDYDRHAVMAAVKRIKHPAPDYIISHMQGERKPLWRTREEPPWA